MKKQFIHYGSTIYNPELVRPIRNIDWRSKPLGGYWMSPIDSIYSWKEWCLEEDFRSDKYFESSVKLEFKDDAKIYIIDSYSDLEKLSYINYRELIPTLDFEKISKEYDAIWLTVKGEQVTRFSKPISLYGWDCESVLVMNPQSIYQIY